jgi:outer membrane protein OmpA-like peptidoglycan-associated protein
MTRLTSASLFLVGCTTLVAQPPTVFRVTVTARTTKAVSYQHRSGSTKIDFRGTDILPNAHGEAKVESKQGHIEIDAEFRDLQPATRNGGEYLTYVLWAVTPEGRTANLGEVLLNGTKSNLHVSTELQVFGLIVTAEPYYAVTRPSDYIVMENEVRGDTVGKVELIDAKFELLKRGQYEHLANPLALKPDKKIPLELYEARNAVAIVRGMGADRFATETFQKAEKSLAQAEAYQARNAGKKPVAMTAREAVQMAEDARVISDKRQDELALNVERQQAADTQARTESARLAAQSDADRAMKEAEATRLRAQADAATAATEADRVRQANEAAAAEARTQADRLRMENEAKLAAAGAETARLKAESEAKLAAAGTETARLQAESDAKLAAAAAEADRLRQENQTQKLASQAELDKAAQQKAQLEAEKAALRSQLLQQFNAILQTRDTARGLIVNMSDVLFDTAKFSLRPLAREKLAKVAGIVSGHPGLKLAVEGHTDSVGGDEYNQKLSEQRGESVRDFLMLQGMPASAVTSLGLGKADPVASNDTAAGRQQNRRVEIVISGDVIGTEITAPAKIQ